MTRDIRTISLPIEGPKLRLRLIEQGDASYVFGVRTNPALNHYLSAVDGTAEDQRRWIDAYKYREARGDEFYFIIERRDGLPCGTVRLYKFEGQRFTWGSWILDKTKPSKAALESAYLIYYTAFYFLRCVEARFDVRRENHNTLAFHRRFGAVETHADERDVFFIYTCAQFDADRSSFLRILENERNT